LNQIETATSEIGTGFCLRLQGEATQLDQVETATPETGTGFCLRLQVEATQLNQIDTASSEIGTCEICYWKENIRKISEDRYK
jgi:hypothetical protein